ncbi:hypothetical protein DL96DRAFT_1734681 [Flagelloscypha sp. PMI_526]|nr:hypothetical protein DL96DRAFT_1734681 [Flagelloscypha sp. PMI_526]
MESGGFSKFQDLPREVRGIVWQIAAQDYSTSQPARLLRVSKESRFWSENLVYESLIAIQPFTNNSLLSHIALRPDLFASTKSVWLMDYTMYDSELALSVLPTLPSLQKVSLFLSKSEFEVFECLLSLPHLKEVHLISTLNVLSISQCNTLKQTYEHSNVTHFIPSLQQTHPGLFGGMVLHLFPRMTHLAVVCDTPPNLRVFQAWCHAAPKSLRVLVVIDQQLYSELYLGAVGDKVDQFARLAPKFTVPIVVLHRKQWDRRELWIKSAYIWEAVDEAVSLSKTRTSESDGSPFILVDALTIG